MTATRYMWLTLFSVLIILSSVSNSLAFKDLIDPKKPKMTCDTSCHLPENILLANQEKFQKKECRACHSFEVTAKGKSQIRPDKNFLLTTNSNPPKNNLGNSSAPDKSITSPPHNQDEMALVPAGEFIMGSNERWDDESPEHINETKAFYIDYYETTNKKYKVFVNATKRQAPHHWPEGIIPSGQETHPVIYVSWFDAHDYCSWAGKRLPNEQEWEKASRGEDGFIYPWGNLWTLDKSNNPYKNSTGTEPIGSYPEGRSPYGLYDTSGNVWEWVDSFYLPHPGNNKPSQEYGEDKRVLKGGSWFDCLSYGCGLSAPTFNRSFFNPEVKNNSFGFRCAKDADSK
jgi:formylglycine-generating enzyme required for sulfatase activity